MNYKKFLKNSKTWSMVPVLDYDKQKKKWKELSGMKPIEHNFGGKTSVISDLELKIKLTKDEQEIYNEIISCGTSEDMFGFGYIVGRERQIRKREKEKIKNRTKILNKKQMSKRTERGLKRNNF